MPYKYKQKIILLSVSITVLFVAIIFISLKNSSTTEEPSTYQNVSSWLEKISSPIEKIEPTPQLTERVYPMQPRVPTYAEKMIKPMTEETRRTSEVGNKKIEIPNITRSLTDQEIFSIMYPLHYRETLSQWQDLMVSDGALTVEERVAFQNEEEIFSFVEKYIKYLKGIGFFSDEDAERYATEGLRAWKEEKIKEIEILRTEGLKQGAILPAYSINDKLSNPSCENKKGKLSILSSFDSLIKTFANLFIPQSVKAIEGTPEGIEANEGNITDNFTIPTSFISDGTVLQEEEVIKEDLNLTSEQVYPYVNDIIDINQQYITKDRINRISEGKLNIMMGGALTDMTSKEINEVVRNVPKQTAKSVFNVLNVPGLGCDPMHGECNIFPIGGGSGGGGNEGGDSVFIPPTPDSTCDPMHGDCNDPLPGSNIPGVVSEQALKLIEGELKILLRAADANWVNWANVMGGGAYICGWKQCAKTGAGIGPYPGAALWAPCCCCRLGKIPIGCLNAVCPYWNAIFDRGTGVCGCDI